MFSRKSDAGKCSGAALRGDRTARMNGRWPAAAGQALLVVVFAAAGLAPNDAEAQAPIVVKPLEDLTLTMGTGPHLVDLRGVYYGELDKCEAVSSNQAVATVTLTAGYDVHVTPVGVGEATITATATNEDGSVDHAFKVTVQQGPPVAVGEFPGRELRVGDVLPLQLSAAFQGEALTYSASSADENAATVAVTGSTANITAIAAGAASITITATNTGGSAEQKFVVRIKDVPPAPVGELADLTIAVRGEPVTVDVAEAFSGSALMFSAASSASDVASVSVADSAATVMAHAAGTATITVTASNSEGRAEQTFTVTAEYEPPAPVGELADLTITVGDDPVAVAVAEAFSGSALMFSAASSASDVAGVSVADSAATVMAHAAGTATITVTASNSEGRAEQTFTVTVKDEPPAPVGELADLTITVGDEPGCHQCRGRLLGQRADVLGGIVGQ